MTDAYTGGPIFGAARRAFIELIANRQGQEAWELFQHDAASNPDQDMERQLLKSHIASAVTTFTYAERDLQLLLRPGLTERDLAETLARWMMFLAGSTVDISDAVSAMLRAAAPQIEAEFAARLSAEFERTAQTGLLVDPIIYQDESPANRTERRRLHDDLWACLARMVWETIGTERPQPTSEEKQAARHKRNEAVQRRLSSALLTEPQASTRLHTDIQFHYQVGMLRDLVQRVDEALTDENVPAPIRDRVIHQLVFGEPPHSGSDLDEQTRTFTRRIKEAAEVQKTVQDAGLPETDLEEK